MLIIAGERMTDFQNGLSYTTPLPPTALLRMGRNEWLDGWLAGLNPDPAQLELDGFLPHQFYSAVVYRVNGVSGILNQLATAIHTEATRRRIGGPVLTFRECVVWFYPVEDPLQTQRLKRISEEVRERLGTRFNGAESCCGVGRPAQATESLGHSFAEAYQAATLCVRLKRESQSTYFGDFSLYSLLNALKTPDELERFCHLWLQHLIEYDDQQRSDLLVTLKVYFDNNGNTARTASTLNIHRNTLAYRLNRIAEITCLDLDDADVRLNLQLALKARQMLQAQAIQ
jgi:purine catabolism regulator